MSFSHSSPIEFELKDGVSVWRFSLLPIHILGINTEMKSTNFRTPYYNYFGFKNMGAYFVIIVREVSKWRFSLLPIRILGMKT